MTTLELAGIAHELKFWQGFVKSDRFLKGWVPKIPTPELNPRVRKIMHELLPGDGDLSGGVLDVGSGVVSILRGFVAEEYLTAVDPLGGLYRLIFDYDKHRIAPPVPVPAEELTKQFPKTVFDLVHCSNALDHVQDPAKAMQQMFAVMRPLGNVIIQGFENEGEFEHYSGFHQWNIILDGNILKIRGDAGGGMDVLEYEGDPARCERFPLEGGKTWYVWTSK